MNANRDNDALSWGGENDPTLEQGTGALPDGWTVPRGAEPATAAPTRAGKTQTPEQADAAGSVVLVVLGILAGFYLLYTVGWFIGASRIENPLTGDPVSSFMFTLGVWLSVAAPLLWFAAAFWLTSGHPRARLVWLILGVIVLAPLPFIFGASA
ncbi:hypothetical protein [Cryobacterium psychrophilum]|uniref:DNA polymerase III subunit gamma/tau n=1 Tax=Cryobacterium psychrophilum TaxID=41988 RepID=A0A4Y8KN60_9MICO|nr:hypothetical protein [Cryobacterium psychrophilum]TDW31143.1 hypothetical protein EDD25_2940 [Cryobacterium psychrophilum]TFD78561.1 hypothetical protein E3T53_10280 [Cryobacterium psychrophilum]